MIMLIQEKFFKKVFNIIRFEEIKKQIFPKNTRLPIVKKKVKSETNCFRLYCVKNRLLTLLDFQYTDDSENLTRFFFI